ncbi:BA14K family protein [Phyllobacterium sp. SB3]|uniref:BA14K family protein n=1 Tax=Phyllobacterium sp. SB3 TaxID=3156073 RepID=UPI0032AECFFB
MTDALSKGNTMKFLAIILLSITTAFSSYTPALALPMNGSGLQNQKSTNLFEIRDRREFRRNNNRRADRHHKRWRGDRDHRRYGRDRRHRNNAGAIIGGLAAGAIIGGVLSSQANSNNSHVQNCYDRYRSYRASDNTYQPTNGPRRQCN